MNKNKFTAIVIILAFLFMLLGMVSCDSLRETPETIKRTKLNHRKWVRSITDTVRMDDGHLYWYMVSGNTFGISHCEGWCGKE